MSEYVIPILILFLLFFCVLKRINAYNCFTQGAKEAFNLTVSIFPYIAAIFVCVALFKASGISDFLTEFLRPFFKLIGVPPELCDIIIIRPLSGNGSIALLEDIINKYGPDSYITRCASVIMGSSETIFYVAAIYFSTSNIKKLRGGILISLIASFVGIIVSCLLCRLM